jgi:PAS domain S-box-containing protein
MVEADLMASATTLSEDIRQGVISHIIRYDLLRRQEFRDAFISAVSPDEFEKHVGHRSRTLWDMIVARSEAYLYDQVVATSDIHLAVGISRATSGRCIPILEKLGIFSLHPDPADLRRTLVNFTELYEAILDGYVENCFVEFEDLINHHHNQERLEAEKALKEIEAHVHLLMDSTAEGIFGVDLDGNCTFANTACLGILGFEEKDSLLGKNMHELIHHSHKDGSKYPIEECQISKSFRREERIHIYDEVLWRTDGTKFPAEIRSYPVKVQEKTIGSVVSFLDISDRKKTEKMLRESEKRFRATFEQAAVGIAHVNPNGRFMRLNQHFCDIVGFSHDDLIGRTCQDITHPDDLDLDLLYVARMLGGEDSRYEMEKRYIRADKSTVWVNLTVSLIRGADDRPAYFVSVIENISDRVEAETALRLVDRAVNASLDGIAIVGRDCRYQYVNDTYVSRYGKSKEKLIGMHVSDLLGQEVFESQIKPLFDRCLAGEKIEFESWFEYPKSAQRYMSVSYTPVPAVNGQIEEIVGIIHDTTDRKLAEMALLGSEERFRLVAETAGDAIIESDKDGNISLWNDSARRIFGYDEAEIIGQPITILIPDQLKSQHLAAFATAHKRNQLRIRNKARDVLALTKEGEEISISLSPSSYINNEQTYYTAIIQNIDERKQADIEVQESEDRYARAVSGTNDGLWDWNIRTGLNYFSPRFEQILGYEEGELEPVLQTFLDLLHPDDNERTSDAISAHLETHVPFNVEYRLRCKDGGYKWINARGQAIWNEQGEPILMAGLITDISEKKEAEASLIESEAKYRDLVETSQDLIWKCDAEARFTYLNPAWEQDIGYPLEEMLGRPFTEFLLEQMPEVHLAEFASHLEGGGVRGHEIIYVSKSGEHVHLLFNAVPLRDRNGAIIGTQGTANNITYRKRAEEKLSIAKKEAEKSNKAKSAFLANMSHDLRTPLTAITGFSGMMKEHIFGPLGDPHYEEYANDIQDSGNLLINMIDSILDLSKVEAGKYELIEENINIPLSIKVSVKMLNKQAEDKKIRLVNSCKPDLPKFYGDEKAVTLVINNLLSNAVKFTPEKGEVTVSAWKCKHNRINVQVSDTGIGMSREDITKALNPFEQVDNEHSRRHEGTGLGLSLCSRFIDLHDGEMSIESEIDKGTTVTVSFPPERVVIDD